MTRPVLASLCGVLLLCIVPGAGPARGDKDPAGADEVSGPAVLTVKVADVRNKKGYLRLGVYQRAAGFPKERGAALLWRSVLAGAEDRSFAVGLPPGTYAVVVLHDENGNKKIDRNFVGIPQEGYGVTNNPKPATRAATYREAAFDLPPGGAEMRVSIQYF